MKYYLIREDINFSDGPQIINWYNKIDIKKIDRKYAFELPDKEIFEIRNNKNVIFVDLISKPFLLVSKNYKEVIAKYEKKTIFKEIVLWDRLEEKVEVYYMPILEKINCLDESSSISLDRSIIKKAVMKYENIKNNSIFQVKDINDLYIVVRLDILESFLRRGIRGIEVIPIDLV